MICAAIFSLGLSNIFHKIGVSNDYVDGISFAISLGLFIYIALKYESMQNEAFKWEQKYINLKNINKDNK